MLHRIAFPIAAALAVAGCATPPPAPASPSVAKAPEALICPPAEKPVCPAPTATPPPPEPELKGRLIVARWSDIPDWGRESVRDSLAAFSRGCATLEKQDAWKGVCAGAATLTGGSERDIVSFFELNFDPWQALNGDDSNTGMVTGYYEPLLHGSRTRTAKYKYPLYSVPQDMLTIDLSSVYPELKGRRLRGRIQGNKVVPYLERGDIDRDTSPPLGGLELAWVDDAIDVFFLHIQGSGQVELENGERIRVGYADQNGHPFKSLGRLLIQRGELPAERASMQGIKDWARRNPAKMQEYLNANPSYVFFRELPKDLSGPIGSLGVPLTPERSIAVDTRVIPLGAPVFLATTFPNSPQPLHRLMVAQDTGGAINGGVRADFYWGFGDAAGAQAGKMRQGGRMWVLYPKGATPPTANNNTTPGTRTP
ncbi:murein transglycosylase A [Usitatibacter rugosus]|nr:MltA domain-containing protein [Usitatibacter rugosus]